MTQYHGAQEGLFHVTTNARGRMPWCTIPGVPEIIIDNLRMTRHLYGAKIHAFCILPDHVHMIVIPGTRGLSDFVHSFKRNSSWQIRRSLSAAEVHEPPLRATNTMYMREDSRIFATETGDAPTGDIEFTGWQKGFHDERIRDDRQKDAAFVYVRGNAAHHGLVSDPADWQWSSLHFFEVVDALEF